MRRTGSVLLFAAISVALHLGWVAWMPAVAPTVQTAERWVEVSFQEEEKEAAPAPVVEAPLSTEPVVREVVRARKPSPTRAVDASPLPSTTSLPSPSPPKTTLALAPTIGSTSAVGVTPPLAAERESGKAVEISPRVAALSIEAFALGPALRCAAPGASQGSGEPRDCAPAEDKAAAAQVALQRDLTGIAARVPHLRTREAPDLKRRSDGSYAYDGHVFQALVQPDGQVEFTDGAAKAQLSASLTPFKVVADVNDLVERHALGRELYSAEKAWFLEQTRELRLQLSAAARRQELQAANRALERTLHEVLGNPALSLPQKHEAVFLIWQDCGEDAAEKAHRRAVEAFVRRYMPKDSRDGFRAEELEQLNARRQRLQRFEPYAGT